MEGLRYPFDEVVSVDDLAHRHDLIDQLLRLGDDVLCEALGNLQYLTSQVGCPNICAFCSQSAATTTSQLTSASLRNVLAALSTVERILKSRCAAFSGIGRSVLRHKPGVLFLYQDTDVASDTNLKDLVQITYGNFDLKSRISTVGWSRHNAQIQEQHEYINRHLVEAIDGFRVSLTPYTNGISQRANSSPEDYVLDVANTLRTYIPVLKQLGPGKDNFSVELRFSPMVETSETFSDYVVAGRHIIQSCDVLLISQDEPVSGTTRIVSFEDRTPLYSCEGKAYTLFRSDHLRRSDTDIPALVDMILRQQPIPYPLGTYHTETCELHRFSNVDGDYYAVNPRFLPSGYFVAMHLYPPTATRRGGINDASRYFLNTLIDYKLEKNIKRKAPFLSAAWRDIDAVLQRLQLTAKRLCAYSAVSAAHVKSAIVPLVEIYAKILRASSLPASAFFDPNFTLDTGQIVNQGRALRLFRGLVSKAEMPLTPHEERGYGECSFSAQRGYVWRIAPSVTHRRITLAALDWRTLEPIPHKTFFLSAVNLTQRKFRNAVQNHLIPGVRYSSGNPDQQSKKVCLYETR